MKFTAQELNAIGQALQLEVERRKYSDLKSFFVAAWPIVEGSNDFRDNWHINVICEHLKAVLDNDLQNLLINIPPGCAKSLLVSVAFPVFCWTVNPELQFFTASYGQELATRDAIKSRAILESSWFLRLWGSKVMLARGQTQKTQYFNTAGGGRIATSVGGRGTGLHPDMKLIDDPHTSAGAQSDAERQSALDWWDLTLSSRGVARNAKSVVVMQRLHEKDLAGHIMASENFATEWEHICLPMEYETSRYTSTIGEDPRNEPNELLWPELFTAHKVKQLKQALGEYGASGQLQQRPSPPGGGILKTAHFQFWPADTKLPAFDYILQSYDTAFKENQDPSRSGKPPDFSACSVYGLFIHPKDKMPAVMVLDAWEERLGYPALRKRAIKDWKARYGGDDERKVRGRLPDAVIIEDKASGQSLIQDMTLANIPVVPYNPGRADKIAKAHMAAPVLELDRFYVLESAARPGQVISWLKFMMDRVAKFPNDEFDDIVDTFTQACIYLKMERMLELDFAEDEPVEETDYHKKRKGNPYAAH